MALDSEQMVELSREFGELGAEIRGDGDNDAALHRLVELVVKHVGGCDSASITMLANGRPFTLASSDELAGTADRLQYELGEGPCLQAATDDTNFLMFDVETEARWPNYTRALAEQTSVRAMLAYQLPVQDSAALNLFGAEAGCFDDDAISVGSIFAAHVSSLVALTEAKQTENHLLAALDSSRHIGTALGVLMAHHKVTQDDAFTMLRQASQRLNRKLRDVAAEVVETGTTPDPPARSRNGEDREHPGERPTRERVSHAHAAGERRRESIGS